VQQGSIETLYQNGNSLEQIAGFTIVAGSFNQISGNQKIIDPMIFLTADNHPLIVRYLPQPD